MVPVEDEMDRSTRNNVGGLRPPTVFPSYIYDKQGPPEGAPARPTLDRVDRPTLVSVPRSRFPADAGPCGSSRSDVGAEDRASGVPCILQKEFDAKGHPQIIAPIPHRPNKTNTQKRKKEPESRKPRGIPSPGRPAPSLWEGAARRWEEAWRAPAGTEPADPCIKTGPQEPESNWGNDFLYGDG